jgi:murein L,D-transpeptidase YcbB/YkuD
MVMTRVWFAASTLGLGSAACRPADTTPQVVTAIQQQLAESTSHSESERGSDAAATDGNAAVRGDVRKFYEQRVHEPAWIVNGAREAQAEKDAARDRNATGAKEGEVSGAAGALTLLRRATEHGLNPADYNEPGLAAAFAALTGDKERRNADDPDAIQARARLDVEITTALLALGRDVAIGRTRPESIDPRWKAVRQAPDLAGTLAQSVTSGIDGWLDRVRPVHPEYAALQKALASDGSMNQLESHRQQIALNMERWRWLPDDLGSRHILVNIPAFHMAVRENGRAVLDMKVVVGTQDHTTPVFSGEMSTVVFSPYWNVPDSIVEGETAPAAARDANYLARNNMEILRLSKGTTTVVDPKDVNWDDPEELKALAFRQKPGASNALGHVKFLFPNKYDVYLHDTPADALFARPGRAFSHGCVRLEQPEVLAKYVMRERPEWDDARIQAAMHAGEEKHVALKEKLPVHIVYFTVWPTDAGGVDAWADIYGYDAKQTAAAIAGPRPRRPVTRGAAVS